jgi:hypothetical protein
MLSAALRKSANTPFTLVRRRLLSSAAPAASTSAATSATPADERTNLTPEQLRALVTLYHQSEDFITLETLDARIDQAFLEEVEFQPTLHSQFALQGRLNARRRAPRVGSPDAALSFRTGQWSNASTGGSIGGVGGDDGTRAMRTAAALLGVDPGGRPGLEVVQEERGRMEQWVRDHGAEIKANAEQMLKR